MTVGCSASLALWDRLSLVTPTSLGLVSAVVLALLGASILIIGIDAFKSTAWRFPALWMSVLFLVVFSAKLFLMRQNPVTSPFWDQWDAEASALFVPFQHCRLAWRALFALHNEHRVFFTRLLALDLLAVNGQWDPRLEQVLNAVLHSFTAVIVATAFWLAGERRRLDLIVLVCALAFALPFSWENTLVGFQSAFYFLLLFSVLALWLTTKHRPRAGAWWLGWLWAVCAIFSAAGGVLIAVSIAAVVALKLAADPRAWRESLMNGGAALMVIGVGVLAAAPAVPYHAAIKAQTASDFFVSLGHALAWPWTTRSPWLGVVAWWPFMALLAAAVRRRARPSEFERFVAGMGIWVALQAGAVAYARGAGGALPANRYMDFISLGFVANTMAILAGVDRTARPLSKRLAFGVLAGWLAIGSVGADRLTSRALADLSLWRQYFSAHAVNVRTYLITNDRPAFLAKGPLVELPYPKPDQLASYLQYPDIRRILPGSIREPVHLTPFAITDHAFVPDGSPVNVHDPLSRAWGSYAEQGRAGQGRFDSQTLASCNAGGRLQFQVSGYLGWPGLYLAVKERNSGREVAVNPARVPREAWMRVVVPCPSGPFSIVAIDASADSWFAFREPVEVGAVSLMSEWLISWSRELFFMSLALALLAARWAGFSTYSTAPNDHGRDAVRDR